ncbi:MAG: tetratricopeptide repeat protein [Planctomycetes bacterium]|nr:tetratricopeptide repeat protein [Planctomycetota bacterium]
MAPGSSSRHVPRRFSARDIQAMYPNLRADRLRCLEKWGLIRAASPSGAESQYGFADLRVIRQASADLGRGAPFRAVLRWLQAAHEGQLPLDFRDEAATARLVPLPRPEEPPPGPAAVDSVSAEEDFEQAAELDEGDPAEQEAAAGLYRRVLEGDPSCVPALVNLANIHHARGALVEAEALYERAIRLAPRSFEAHFNLGNLHHDRERLEQARACYERAVSINPACADAHFYLAVTLEKLGSPADARPHWRMYQHLAPNGEWAQLASEFSE